MLSASFLLDVYFVLIDTLIGSPVNSLIRTYRVLG